MDFKKLLGLDDKEERLGSFYKQLTNEYNNIASEELKLVVGLAGLLAKVAQSDQDFSKAEFSTLIETLGEYTKLSKTDLNHIGELAKKYSSDLSGIEDHYYTRMLNSVLDRTQKVSILEKLFLLAACDDELSASEEHSLRAINSGLGLANQDFINAKLKHREHLSVIKNSKVLK